MENNVYIAWDGNQYQGPPPDGWYLASDDRWWPEGYGPRPAPPTPGAEFHNAGTVEESPVVEAVGAADGTGAQIGLDAATSSTASTASSPAYGLDAETSIEPADGSTEVVEHMSDAASPSASEAVPGFEEVAGFEGSTADLTGRAAAGVDETVSGAFDRVPDEAHGMTDAAADSMTDSMTDAVTDAADSAEPEGDGSGLLGGLGSGLGNVVENSGAKTAGIAGAVGAAGTAAAGGSGALSKVSDLLGGSKDGAADDGGGLTSSLSNALPDSVSGAMPDSLSDSVSGARERVSGAMPDSLSGARERVSDALPDSLSGGGDRSSEALAEMDLPEEAVPGIATGPSLPDSLSGMIDRPGVGPDSTLPPPGGENPLIRALGEDPVEPRMDSPTLDIPTVDPDGSYDESGFDHVNEPGSAVPSGDFDGLGSPSPSGLTDTPYGGAAAETVVDDRLPDKPDFDSGPEQDPISRLLGTPAGGDDGAGSEWQAGDASATGVHASIDAPPAAYAPGSDYGQSDFTQLNDPRADFSQISEPQSDFGSDSYPGGPDSYPGGPNSYPGGPGDFQSGAGFDQGANFDGGGYAPAGIDAPPPSADPYDGGRPGFDDPSYYGQPAMDLRADMPEKPKRRWLSILLGVIALVIAGVAGYLAYDYFGSNDDGADPTEATSTDGNDAETEAGTDSGDTDGGGTETAAGAGTASNPHPPDQPVSVFWDMSNGEQQRWLIKPEAVESVDNSSVEGSGESYAATSLIVLNQAGVDGADLNQLLFKAVAADGDVYERADCPGGDVLPTGQVGLSQQVEGNVCWLVDDADLSGLMLAIESTEVPGTIHVSLP